MDFTTSTQVNFIVFSLFFLFFACDSFYCFLVSVSDSVSVCPFAAVMANKDLYTTASAPIQPIQEVEVTSHFAPMSTRSTNSPQVGRVTMRTTNSPLF